MYKIKLHNFEGPFDLLLYFIKRDEINIYDIPIARITEEYLKYIRLMQQLDLELAGEFIFMAATLMYIKAKMLIPREQLNQDDEEFVDPRTELVERLIEYKQIKDAAIEFGELAEEQRYTYYRNIFDSEQTNINQGKGFKNATLFDLLKAFKTVLERAKPVEPGHIVNMQNESIEERKSKILNMLARRNRMNFTDMFDIYTKPKIVLTFLAILELIKNKRIIIQQNDTFEEIVVILLPGMN